jgi:hypothetical protein
MQKEFSRSQEDSWDSTSGTRKPGTVTVGTAQQGQDSRNSTAGTGQPEQNRHDRTAETAQLGQDGVDRTSGT